MSNVALTDAETAVHRGVRSIWMGFVEFALRDNVLEVAVGLIIASSFVAVVKSLVSDIILPPLSLIPFVSRSVEEKFLILKRGHGSIERYNTRTQAIEDGAVILSYGAFTDKFVNFIGIGLVLYLIARLYETLSRKSVLKYTIKCPFCRKDISSKARRCAMCTSWLDGREERETSALSA